MTRNGCRAAAAHLTRDSFDERIRLLAISASDRAAYVTTAIRRVRKSRSPLALVLALAFAGLLAPSATASPLLFTDSSKATALRDLYTAPKGYPDVLEFAAEHPVTFSSELPTGRTTVQCHEVELDATSIINNGAEETTLSLPFGVFEGDRCVASTGALVPTRFEALPPGQGTGVVGTSPKTALVTVTGSSAPFTAILHHLKIWQGVGGKFCAWNLDLIHGVLEDATAGFVEDAPPNLRLRFPSVVAPITDAPHGTGCPQSGTLQAEFFLETMSPATDTAFIG